MEVNEIERYLRHLSSKQKKAQLCVIYFQRDSVFKICYVRFILNYPTHSHDHVIPKLRLTLQKWVNTLIDTRTPLRQHAYIEWAASSEKVLSTMRKIGRFRSSSACAKYYRCYCFLFIHSIVSNNFVSGQWRLWSDCADAQSDQGLRCPHMPVDKTRFRIARPKIVLQCHSILLHVYRIGETAEDSVN